MSNKTYLETVNEVLVRLRENEVSSVTQTAYSKLIGAFVNDAREYVEGRYKWLSLKEVIEITTSAGTSDYAVDGVGDQAIIQQVIDDTNNRVLKFKDAELIQRELEINPPVDGQPVNYTFMGVESDGDPTIRFRPAPADIYSIKVHTDKTGVEFSQDSDTISVPYNLVLQLALALARGERGETGGASDLNTFPLADIYIQNAIIAEASKSPDEQMWCLEGEIPSRTNVGT